MSTVTEDFVRLLVRALPDLEPRYAAHLEDNFGRALPHLFAAQVAFDAAARFDRDGAQAVVPLLLVLEGEAGRDPEVDEVIAASFVENLPYPGQEGEGLTRLLGPRLRAMLEQQRGGETLPPTGP